MKGAPARIPLWAMILEAANGDPLQAQEIEEKISEYWWVRWRLWHDAKVEGTKHRMNKGK